MKKTKKPEKVCAIVDKSGWAHFGRASVKHGCAIKTWKQAPIVSWTGKPMKLLKTVEAVRKHLDQGGKFPVAVPVSVAIEVFPELAKERFIGWTPPAPLCIITRWKTGEKMGDPHFLAFHDGKIRTYRPDHLDARSVNPKTGKPVQTLTTAKAVGKHFEGDTGINPVAVPVPLAVELFGLKPEDFAL